MALAALLTSTAAAALVATALPLLVLLLVHALDLYGTGSRRAILFSLLWGALSVLIAAAIYASAPARLTHSPAMDYLVPVLEETLKALALIYLVRRPTFTYFVDGALYGFAVGIGFAVAENYLYIFPEIDASLATALGRVLSTNMMHASAGAIVGIALGLSRFQPFGQRIAHLLSGLFLAILLHAAFNRLVSLSDSGVLFLYAAGVGFLGLAFTALTIRRGIAIQKRWIAESLGSDNRVTAAEISASGQLERAERLLGPLAALFGDQKAAQIEELLLLQAQLGILRKTRARMAHDGSEAQALTARIRHKQEEMEAARRAIGAYTMVSLRMLFPQDGAPLWQRLQADIALHGEDQNAPNNASDLFTLLDQRIDDS